MIETGCIFDSHHGIYIPEMICELATTYGWKGSWSEENGDDLIEASDEAIAWMNDNVAHGEYSFGWWDGDFVLWSEKDWEEAFLG